MEPIAPREPRFYAWLMPGRLAVAERPGRGGRSHRRELRDAEIAWWKERGVTGVVSGMRSRHGIMEYALTRLRVRWRPLADVETARLAVPALASDTLAMLDEAPGAVLVHCDRPGEWLTAIDAALRLRLDLAPDPETALAQAAADGLPVGALALELLGLDQGDAQPADLESGLGEGEGAREDRRSRAETGGAEAGGARGDEDGAGGGRGGVPEAVLAADSVPAGVAGRGEKSRSRRTPPSARARARARSTATAHPGAVATAGGPPATGPVTSPAAQGRTRRRTAAGTGATTPPAPGRPPEGLAPAPAGGAG